MKTHYPPYSKWITRVLILDTGGFRSHKLLISVPWSSKQRNSL
jgi:hypothetical protein